jgi:hypothetical protein
MSTEPAPPVSVAERPAHGLMIERPETLQYGN